MYIMCTGACSMWDNRTTRLQLLRAVEDCHAAGDKCSELDANNSRIITMLAYFSARENTHVILKALWGIWDWGKRSQVIENWNVWLSSNCPWHDLSRKKWYKPFSWTPDLFHMIWKLLVPDTFRSMHSAGEGGGGVLCWFTCRKRGGFLR